MAGAAGVVLAGTILTKLLAIGREVTVASAFGSGDQIDAFMMAMVLPTATINIIALSLQCAFVPPLVAARENGGLASARRFLGGILSFGIVLLLGCCALLAAAGPVALGFIARGFSPEKLALTVHLHYLLLPMALLAGMGVVVTGALNAVGRFSTPAFVTCLSPICAGIGVVTHPDLLTGLVTGTVIGSACELIVLGIALNRAGLLAQPHAPTSAEMALFVGQFMSTTLSMLIMTSTTLVDQIMASWFDPGSMARLAYANRIVAMPLSLGLTAFSAVLLPGLSTFIANREWSRMQQALRVTLRLVLACTVPITALLMLASGPLVALLFERGAFSSSDTAEVSLILCCMAIQVPFYACFSIGVRTLAALGMNNVLPYVAMMNLSINIAGNIILGNMLGVCGIALSSSIVFLLATLVAWRIVHGRIETEVLNEPSGQRPS